MNQVLDDFLREAVQLVEQAMNEWLSEKNIFLAPLYEAMRYSANSGGKRLRPSLLLMTGQALGLRRETILPAACALEMIHTYSLIHDDLPAMDNDDLRRGKPTNHKVFGEALAILAGDGLLTLAFEVLTASPLPAEQVVAMTRELAQAAGPLGMVGGQVADILEEGKPVSEDLVQFIHERKTGALIRSAVVLPALAAEVSAETMARLITYGETIGLAFQIQDDILDVTGTTEILGKTAGADAKLQKATYPALYGVDTSKRMVEELTLKAIKAIEGVEGLQSIDHLLALAEYLSSRNH